MKIKSNHIRIIKCECCKKEIVVSKRYNTKYCVNCLKYTKRLRGKLITSYNREIKELKAKYKYLSTIREKVQE